MEEKDRTAQFWSYKIAFLLLLWNPILSNGVEKNEYAYNNGRIFVRY